MWRVSLILKNETPSINNLQPWISGETWADSFFLRTNYSKDLQAISNAKI